MKALDLSVSRKNIQKIIAALLTFLFALSLVSCNLPQNKIELQETDDSVADKPIPDGTVQNGDLWNFYKDKTLSDVLALRPGIINTGGDLYILEQYGDSERSALLGGSFEDEELSVLSFVLSNSDPLCGTTSEEDKKILSDFAAWALDRMGLSVSDMDYVESDSFAYYTDYDIGIRCGYDMCPGGEGGIAAYFGCANLSSFAEYEGW